MGTNYYAMPKFTDDLKLKVIQAVINNQINELRNLIPKQIHIGKSSAGWRFLFNHNNWEYFKNTDELYDFILKSDIINEYDEPVHNLIETIRLKQKVKLIDEYNRELYIIKNGYTFSTSTDFS